MKSGKTQVGNILHKDLFLKLFGISTLFLLLALIVSIFRSGFNYQFDIDELYFAQRAFLFSHGLRPYVDVYLLTYTPVFDFIMMPIFKFTGFSFAAIYAAREVMMGLFIVRFVVLFLAVKKLFNLKIASLFIVLVLLDPFLVLTGMQYRSDNLMLTLFSLGLYVSVVAWERKNSFLFLCSGIFFSASVITLYKLVPSVIPIVLLLLFFLWKARKRNLILPFIGGLAIPVLGFVLYLVTTGVFVTAFQQLVSDTWHLYRHFNYPIPIYFLYRPDNFPIFGAAGKPITWFYSWLLLGLGIAGFSQFLTQAFESKHTEHKNPIRLSLLIILPLQWGALFLLDSVFLQYYMTVNWLLALFAALFIFNIYNTVAKNYLIASSFTVLVTGLLLLTSIRSIQYNIARSKITSTNLIASYQSRWSQIGENQHVFPGFLFRLHDLPDTVRYAIIKYFQ